MMRLAALCLGAIACGRIGFGERSITGDAAPGGLDAPGDGAPASGCWAAWLAHTVTFGQPHQLAELSVAGVALGVPTLSADGLQIWYTRSNDIFTAKRPSRGAPFANVVRADDLSSQQADGRTSVTADGLLAILSAAPTANDFDLLQATRSTTAGAFSAPSANFFPASIDSAQPQTDPYITADGLHVFFISPLSGNPILWEATRTARDGVFGNPSSVGVGLTNVASPSLSPDLRVIVFSAIDQGATTPHLFYATRSGETAQFTATHGMAGTVMQTGEPAVFVAADGCEVVFASAQTGTGELYTAAAS
jgi:hypothetical protein